MSLDELCATADYLTLHLPSTPETKHLFNDERFAAASRASGSSTPRAAS